MRCVTTCRRWLAATLFLAAAGAAQAGQLDIVEVRAPEVNCIFNLRCTVFSINSLGNVGMPLLDTPNTAWLLSRTFRGAAGSPAAGLNAYEYRVSLTRAAGFGDCLLGFVIDFGPITKLRYDPEYPPADIYVVSLGGLGTIGLTAAEQDGDVITFWLKSPLCPPLSPDAAATTFHIGLASERPPAYVDSLVFAYGSPAFYSVRARAPAH